MDKQTFRGTIIFQRLNAGSKSDAAYPMLYVCKETSFKLLLKGDNPFENKGLLPYDGKFVEICGEKGRSSFIVETVKLLLPESQDAVAPSPTPTSPAVSATAPDVPPQL